MSIGNIFKKDPSYYQNLLVKFSKKTSYVPLLSGITAVIDLYVRHKIKNKLNTLTGREELNSNPYYVYINSNARARSILLFIPILGNLMVALMDFTRSESVQLEKKSQSPRMQFQLAKRYLTGNGVKRNLEKSQKLFTQALKDLNNPKIRSFYALQYLDHVFTAFDHPYTRAVNLIKGIKEVEELSNLKKICLLRASEWEKRVEAFRSKPKYDIEEFKEMNLIKNGYLNAATFCDKRIDRIENPVELNSEAEAALQDLINIVNKKN